MPCNQPFQPTLTNGKLSRRGRLGAGAMHIGSGNLQLVGARRQRQLLGEAGDTRGGGAVGNQAEGGQGCGGAAGTVQQSGVPGRSERGSGLGGLRTVHRGKLRGASMFQCSQHTTAAFYSCVVIIANSITDHHPSCPALGADEGVGLGGGPLEHHLAHRGADALGASQQGGCIRQAQHNGVRLGRLATVTPLVGGGELRWWAGWVADGR